MYLGFAWLCWPPNHARTNRQYSPRYESSLAADHENRLRRPDELSATYGYFRIERHAIGVATFRKTGPKITVTD